MALAGFLIIGQNVLNFSSTKFRLIWVFLFTTFFLGEQVTFLKAVGTLCTVTAGLCIVHVYRQIGKYTGVFLATAATIVYAVVIIFYKYLFVSFNTASLTFFIFLIPAVVIFYITPNAARRIYSLYRTKGKAVFYACFAGGIANLSMNRALSLGEASRVLVIIESFLVITLIGEHIFFRERFNFRLKIVAVTLATIGAIAVRL